MGLFRSTLSAVKKGLTRTREALGGGLRSLLLGRTLSPELIDEIETRLLKGDVGVTTSTAIISQLRESYRAGKISKGEDVLAFLKSQLRERWPEADRALATSTSKPTVILVAGVN